MLPNEILLNVLRWFDRKGLDVVEITSRLLSSLVVTHLDTQPFRPLRMRVDFHKDPQRCCIAFTSADGWDEYMKIDDDLFPLILRRAFLTEVDYVHIARLDDWMLDILMPYADKLRTAASCITPSEHASDQVLERAFTELFYAHELNITSLFVQSTGRTYTVPGRTFFDLPSVRQSKLLVLSEGTLHYVAYRLLEWLNSGEAKKVIALRISLQSIGDIIHDLELIFNEAVVASEFELTIRNDISHDSWRDYEELFVKHTRETNEITGEELVRECEINKLNASKASMRMTIIRRAIGDAE